MTFRFRPTARLGTPAAALLLSAGASAQTACSDEELFASDAASGARFGFSVDVEGDFAAVGSPFAQGATPLSGAVYVFERVAGGWAEVAKLSASDGAPGDSFGNRLDIDGDRLLVGSVWKDGPGVDAGRAYVFERQGASWVETQILKPSDHAEGDWFGREVSIDGDRLVVGASLKGAGAVYVFEHNGSAWGETVKLSASDGAAGDFFGGSLDLDGDRLLIGAHGRDDVAFDAGGAYVFDLQGATWVETTKLTAADGAVNDDLASEVALDGDTVLLASFGDDKAAADGGSVYVFEHGGGAWSQTAELTASDAAPGGGFGSGLELDGDVAVVGAWHADGGGTDAGAVYAFRRTGGAFAEEAKLPGPGAGAIFGFHVALDGTTVVLGAPESASAATEAGEVRVGRLAAGAILFGCPVTISLGAGGTQSLHVDAGASLAGFLYFVAGSASGVAPGFAVGPVAVPLNPDGYFLFTVSQPGAPPLVATFGTLDAAGRATASIAVPPGFDPSLAGAHLDHAALVIDPVSFKAQVASGAEPLDLTQ